MIVLFVITVPSIAQDKIDPGETLYGEWEIVEITFKQRVQSLPREPVGFFIFEMGGFIWILYGDPKATLTRVNEHRGFRRSMTQECAIEPGVIHVQDRYNKDLKFTALYEIKDEMLRFVWNERTGKRPADFEALKDPNLALYVAKKVK